MIRKLLLVAKTRGALGLFFFLCSRLIRKQTHAVFVCETRSSTAPARWQAGETALEAHNAGDVQALTLRIAYTPAGLEEYFAAIREGSAVGIFVLLDGQLAHWAFLMRRSRTLCYLGFDRVSTALLGSAFTAPDFRGRGLQTRSVAYRIDVARRCGYQTAVSETAPDNEFSARALQGGGMTYQGNLRVWVICNRLVLRFRNRTKPRISLSYCA